jgi:hypothetical protein
MTEPLISPELYQWLIYAWIGLAVVVFFVLLKVTAPYGRHVAAQWGPQIGDRLGWFLMEVPVLIVLYSFIIPVWHNLDLEVLIMIGLFSLHYIHRTFIYPFRLHTRGKYIPILIVCSGMLFNIVNGFLLGYFFAYLENYPTFWFADPRFIIGVIVFFIGLYINWRADTRLIHLRKPHETHYVIPRGWLFEKISCPNHFGELIEWLGYAILCWSMPAFTFFIWTAANLIPRAISHHKWYRSKFSDYPQTRKAVLPYFI